MVVSLGRGTTSRDGHALEGAVAGGGGGGGGGRGGEVGLQDGEEGLEGLLEGEGLEQPRRELQHQPLGVPGLGGR